MKLTEIAARINAHLKRIEADSSLNKRKDHLGAIRSRLYWAGAWQSGRYCCVQYVAYQGSTALIAKDAEKYLCWLDEGNVGQHYKALAAHSPAPKEPQ